MVINAEDIDLRPLYVAIGTWLVSMIVLALVVAFVARRLGRRRFGCAAMILISVIAVTGTVIVWVALLVALGEASIWDGVWMLLLAPVTVLCLRILLAPADRRDDES